MFEDTLRVVATLADREPIQILPVELDGLFLRLAAARDINAAGAIEDQIWEIWTSFPDPAAERMMNEAIAAIASKQHREGLALGRSGSGATAMARSMEQAGNAVVPDGSRQRQRP